MAQAAYVAAIHEENGVFGVSFPDLPGCVTTAADMASAIERGEQALALHIEGMSEDGEALPEPRTVERLRADEPGWMEGALLALIPVEVPGKALRVNISLDEGLLALIDKAAARSGQTRSGFLASAARERIKALGGASRGETEESMDRSWITTLDVVNCAQLGNEVIESGAYTCPIEGNAYQHKRSRFFGLYRNKQTEMVSEIEAVVDVDLDNDKVEIKWKNVDSPDEEIQSKALERYEDRINRNVFEPGHPQRIFILGELFQTSFEKDSGGGMYQSKRYFDVSQLKANCARELANKLKNKKWSEVPGRVRN